ncbi:MAG: ATP-dependent helicase [Patescibacteria group bacterium]|nr:ATP-dependent helicase [Patescibacteria group bacterium]
MLEEKFREEYSKLNSSQKRAVDTIEGPVMVVAGPGTGKTTTLVLRIANIIKSNIPSSTILALTFTESAAANMRRRLVELVGSEGYYVNINTFHGFCNALIQNYPQYFERIISAENATEAKQIALLREIIDGGQFKKLKPIGDKYAYVKDIASSIKNLKNDKYSPEELAEIVAKKNAEIYDASDLYHDSGRYAGQMKGKYFDELERLKTAEELALVYAEYEKALRARNLYDFDDMILETIKAFEENTAFLSEMQETCQYILVDEHQDTNRSQNYLLELIAGFYESPNLFVVGDEKQAIFRFQGASLQNFLYLQNKYKNTTFIKLEKNYRSTQTILDSAHSLIQKNKANIDEGGLEAEDKSGGERIKVAEFRSAEAEAIFVADEIEKKIKEGGSLKEMAVIYRENRDAEAFADVLRSRRIPIAVRSDQNILFDKKIRKLIALLRAVEYFGDDTRLVAVMHLSFLELDPLDIYRVVSAAEGRRTSSVYGLIASEEKMEKIGVSAPQKFRAFYENLRQWKRLSVNRNFLEFFEILVKESGFFSDLSSSGNYLDELGKLKALFSEARKEMGVNYEYRLGDFLRHIDVLEEHKLSISVRENDASDAVRLMTAHKAKGLEFGTVFIVNAVDGKWGNKRDWNKIKLPLETGVDISKLEKNEDERRIFYMSLTRAKKEVFITYALKSAEGKEKTPSQFIGEIDPSLIDRLNTSGYARKEEEGVDGVFVGAASASSPTLLQKDEIRALFLKRGFSATHLNNYLNCPWRYFYVNLLRIPQTMKPSQIYGSCIHGALDEFFRKKALGEAAGEEYLVSRFSGEAERQPLSENDRKRLLEKGRETLRKYYEFYHGDWSWNVVTEYSVSANLTDEVRLSGRLDKVELEPDGVRATVVDYKTHKPESENWIRGETKASSGDYYRQLIFYKLLLDLDPRRKYKMAAGTIDFVQPDEKGKFVRRSFAISDQEEEELKSLILEKTDEIMNLKFWNKTCGEPKCEFCALRSLLNK